MKDCSITNEQMEEVYKIIGQNVKRVRTSKNISQLALSLAIGHKSVGTIAVAEIYHKNKHFNIEHLVKIADVLEVDICEFFKPIK
ncbi:helix-turn-helix domain-containing protein [Aliarcobacter vitoriensis]|uniref:helix-turn-helix domain-containing protein n=1 Tax=Aliarcobacter vitoriensis TaxID=2011099 RepID=UPI003AAC1474